MKIVQQLFLIKKSRCIG